VGDDAQRFPTTQWSVVVAAQGAKPPDVQQALERLFKTYWYPIYAFIRRRTSRADDAEDLTQGFFASLLSHCSLDTVRPELGRFRAFLLASAKHYLSVERTRGLARKRGGGAVLLSLDFDSADMRYRVEASRDANPEMQFERQWARAAFEAAEEELRQQYSAAGNAVFFEAIRQYLDAAEQPEPYAEVAGALELSEAALKVSVHRARRRFGRLLRERIADTVAPASETTVWRRAVEDEVCYLFRILGR
jgi:RNA polymerase sigma-70 factor (ECF subfamily)